ncbi:MAG: 6-bladed beta-propeller [Gemmatimonadota bacterium]
MKRFLLALLLVLGALCAVVLVPPLLRRDSITFVSRTSMGEGVLSEPIGIAYRGGRLYVSDAGNNRIVVFDTAGAVDTIWDGPELDLGRPMHITFDANGLLLVSEYLNDRVTVFDTTGAVVEHLGGISGSEPGELDAPGGAVEVTGEVFIADFYNHRVDVLGGASPRTVGRPGRIFSGRLHYPTDVDTDGELVYVADAYNHRIQVFRPDGTFVRKWGGPLGMGGRGGFRGWFRVATGVAVSGERVYAADFENNRIQTFTLTGRYLGTAEGGLRHPTDMTTGARDELYVVDFGNDRVVRFEGGAPDP